MIADSIHLSIGSLLFEGIDQIDLTGPFEVLSRLPTAKREATARRAAARLGIAAS